MNRIRLNLTALLAVFVTLTFFIADVSAYYHPGMGVFLTRDPGAGSATRIGSAGVASSGGFIPRDQYADGMNLYQYVRSNPINGTDPSGLLTLNQTAQMIIAHRPVGVHEKFSVGLMLCLLWKESNFDERLTNPDSSAKGIAQILDDTADDIQDRIGPNRFGIPRDPFYILPKDKRLRDNRFNPGISIYAAFLYLEDRRIIKGGDWKEGVKGYGPNGDKVIKCSECCGVVEFNKDYSLKNQNQVQQCLNKIHE